MKRLVFTACFVLIVAPSIAADRFAQMDADGDGFVSWSEFSTARPNMKRQAFDTIDADRDSRLSRMEWSSFSSQHGMKKGAMPGMGQAHPDQPNAPLKKPLVKPPKP